MADKVYKKISQSLRDDHSAEGRKAKRDKHAAKTKRRISSEAKPANKRSKKA